MPAAEFDVQTISLESSDMIAGKPVILLAKARKMTAPGWRTLLKTNQQEGEGRGLQNAARLPTLEIGQQITALSGAVKSLITKAPARYSEGSLVQKMESLGIGRPGTYASAIKTIKSKEYAVIKLRFFHATDTGISAIGTLSPNFSFLDYKYTAGMEDRLDAITSGNAVFRDTVRAVHQDLGTEIKAMGGRVGESYPCPKCGAELRVRKGPKGLFWGCSKFPACKGTAEDREGKPLLTKAPVSNT
jgi:DNA topoisomerase-1